jgi:hypothetical protein
VALTPPTWRAFRLVAWRLSRIWSKATVTQLVIYERLSKVTINALYGVLFQTGLLQERSHICLPAARIIWG